MRTGILIVGSLWWDTREERTKWREESLLLKEAIRVKAPLRYSRRSQSRGGTFTMVLSTTGGYGEALIVPCRNEASTLDALVTEAEHLWAAEQPGAAAGSISAAWGSVGVRFRDESVACYVVEGWADHFANNGKAVPPITTTGKLNIPWPFSGTTDAVTTLDLILATATQAESTPSTPEKVADAWIEQDEGQEAYFFENVRYGIRTPEDVAIWRRIEQRKPEWLSNSQYSDVVEILRAEASSV
jgi:hypothetical protein